MPDTKVMDAKLAMVEVARGLDDQYDFVTMVEWKHPDGTIQPVCWQMRLTPVRQGFCKDPYDGHLHSHRGDH